MNAFEFRFFELMIRGDGTLASVAAILLAALVLGAFVASVWRRR